MGAALYCILYLSTSICFRAYVCMMIGFLFSPASSHGRKELAVSGDIIRHLWWLSGLDCRDIIKYNSTLQQLQSPPFCGQKTSIECGTVFAAGVKPRASGASDGTEMVPILVGPKIGSLLLSNSYLDDR